MLLCMLRPQPVRDIHPVLGPCFAAGPKSTTVQLLPRAGSSVTWQAVAYHTGALLACCRAPAC